MRSINSGVGDFMDDQEYYSEDEEYFDEHAKFQRKCCVFCGQMIGKSEYTKFNFPAIGQKYEVAHFKCFQEKCRDLGIYEDAVEEILDCLGIEIEY